MCNLQHNKFPRTEVGVLEVGEFSYTEKSQQKYEYTEKERQVVPCETRCTCTTRSHRGGEDPRQRRPVMLPHNIKIELLRIEDNRNMQGHNCLYRSIQPRMPAMDEDSSPMAKSVRFAPTTAAEAPTLFHHVSTTGFACNDRPVNTMNINNNH